MSLSWIRESPAQWDAKKAAIVGGAPSGAFVLGGYGDGDPIPGEWWRVDDDGETVGYGWMDRTWEGAEILLAVASDRQSKGVGTFILDHLEGEAAERGCNYMFNTVRADHPDKDRVTRWLEERGFSGTEDGELRRQVKSAGA